MSRPSLRAVAEAAGVSVSSVSNAYNRPERLSAAVRERVLAVAREIGYPGPNPAARSLRTNRVEAVGVLLTTPLSYVFSDPYCTELLRGIGEVAQQTRTALVLIPLVDADAARQAVVDAAITDGLDADHPALQVLAERGIPLARSTDAEAGRCVVIDDFAAGRLIGEHLAERGHRDVVILLGSSDEQGVVRSTVEEATLYSYSRRRSAGIRDALGPRARVRVVSVGGNNVAAGRAAAELVLDLDQRPTAVAADSDVLASGVLQAIRERGLQPGADVAVTGFDDLPIAQDADLTTVRQPIREKGRLLARMVLDRAVTEDRIVLDTALVPRGSSGVARSAPRSEQERLAAVRSAPANAADEWHIDDLDVVSYLHRIRFEGDLTPTESTFRALHRAHIAAFPFENLDVILGRGIAVNLPDIQTKLVYRRRGGYCYEQNLLFGAVLERLGFRVQRWLARTGDPMVQPRPHSHLVLAVGAGDRRWLADVGFGSGLLEPIPLADRGALRQGGWTFHLRAGRDGAWRLRELRSDGWTTLYTFTEEPQYQVDMEMANHNTSTHPGSPFVQRPIVVCKDETNIRQLSGRDFTCSDPDRTIRTERIVDDRYGDLLISTFGLPLADEDVATLVAALPQEPGTDE